MKIGSGDNVMFERDREMTKKGKKKNRYFNSNQSNYENK